MPAGQFEWRVAVDLSAERSVGVGEQRQNRATIVSRVPGSSTGGSPRYRDEFVGLEAGAAHQGAIDLRGGEELGCVGGGHGAAV